MSLWRRSLQPPAITYPSLGDSRKRYVVELTEPEINAIAALTGFTVGACREFDLTGFLKHYRAAIDSLCVKFEPFEDGNAPYAGEGPVDLREKAEHNALPILLSGMETLVMSVSDAVAMIRATPQHKRQEFAEVPF